MTTPSPCRITVFLARERPLAVVLRRGPSAWARLSVWHTDTDVFEHGQWFRGRVYERRSDISADGSLFVYFARKDSPPGRGDLPHDSWIALSRPPWFTATALWGIGGTYCTGGYFPDGGSLYLSGIVDEPDKGQLPDGLRVTGEHPPYSEADTDWPENRVYFSRLLRDGCRPLQELNQPRAWWEHLAPDGRAALVMMPQKADFTSFGGYHAAEYAVRDVSTGAVEDVGAATWADWDQRGRLVVAQEGRLLVWEPGSVAELCDFNGQRPDPQPAPASAQNIR